MGETGGSEQYNAKNFLHPLEGGLVAKFDKLFEERQKNLKKWAADAITHKQEFLTRTFPNLITIGAQHPELSGGVLYMLGLVSPHIKDGSEAINSIPRRFAERQATKKDKTAGTTLHELHKKQETMLRKEPTATPPAVRPELSPVINRELTRTKITRELYTFDKKFTDVKYEKNGAPVDLGKNACLVSTLNSDSTTGKTMVFLCSSGGDPPGVESFAVEYAMRTGDKVYVVGMPDSASGSMTPEFAQAAYADARPPAIDLFRKFKTPTYEAHTMFFRSMIESLVPPGKRFDLYSHSGGALAAKNLLNMENFTKRVENAVFLNPAGTADLYTRLPFLFRIKPIIAQWWATMLDLPRIIRTNYEKDNRQDAKTLGYRFRDAITVAIQDGSHYRQPGWDTMNVHGGKIVLYVGGKDFLVGGKQFATFMKNSLSKKTDSPIHLEYDKGAHHVTPFTEPEKVVERLFSKYFPTRLVSTG